MMATLSRSMRAATGRPRSIVRRGQVAPLMSSRRRAGTTKAVRVVAYRDEHREQLVEEVGRHVLEGWFKGMRDTAAAAAPALDAHVDPNVRYRSEVVTDVFEGVGLELVKRHHGLERRKMEVDEWELVASAVSGAGDSFFALVRYTYHLEALRGETSPCEGFKIFEFDVMVDDTKRVITAIRVRSQLAPEDVGAFSTIDRARVFSAPFPYDRLRPYPPGLDNAKVHASIKAWCGARCSGHLLDRPLYGALTPGFRLHDAYGLLPVLCDPARAAAGAVDACVADRARVVEILEASRERYEVHCKVVDCAVSRDSNVAFTRWRSDLKSRSTGAAFAVEGIEVDLFDGDGRLTDAWLFRDPMDFEREMLLGGAAQGGAGGPGVRLIP